MLMKLSAMILTERLLIACLHVFSAITRFSAEASLCCSSSSVIHPLPLHPKSLLLLTLFCCRTFPALPRPSIPLLHHLPHLPTNVHLCLPRLISSPRVRDQSGEGANWGSNEGLELRARQGAICTVTPRGARGREITRSSLTRQSSRRMRVFTQAAPIKTFSEKKHTKDIHTQTPAFFGPFRNLK